MTKIAQKDEFRNRVFECSPLPIVVMDAETHRYIDCNPAAAKIYRYASPHEVIGKEPLDFSAPVQYDGTPSARKAADYIKQAQREGSVQFEWLHRHPDGELWDAEVHLQSFETDSAKLLQFSLIDITERKRSEQMQRIIHDLALALNSCSDLVDGFTNVLHAVLQIESLDCGGIYLADPLDGSLSLVAHQGLSPDFIKLVSYFSSDSPNVQTARNGAARYGTYADICPASDPVRENEHLQGFALIPIMAEGSLLALLNLASRRHDTIPPLSRTTLETIAFQVGGSLLRLRSEAALREGDEILAAYMHYSPIMAYIKEVTPTESIVLQASDSFIELIGRSGRDIVGKTMHELFPAEFAEKIIADDRNVISGTTPVRLEEEFNGKFFTTIKFPVRKGNRTLLCGYTIDVTEKKNIELTLRDSEEKYRTLFTTMTQGVVYQDAQGHIIDANPAAERILGLTLDQMQGRTSMDPRWKSIREDGTDFPGAEHPIPVALRTGKEVRNVVHGIYNPQKGSIVWISVSAIPLFRPGEATPWQAYATIEDITERKAAVEHVLASERRFRELIRNSSDSVTILDNNGTQIFVSDAVERMLGFTPSELINIPVIETMLHPDDQLGVRKAFERIFKEGEGVVEYRHRRKDGSWAHLEAWGTNQLDNPDIRGVIVNVRDISERKKSENELRLRESYLSAIIENQPGLVWLKNSDGKFLAVNRAFAISCGKTSPDHLTGKTDLDIWPAELAEKYRADDTAVISSGKPVIIEEPIFSHDETRWFETFKAPVRDSTGKIIGTTGYSRDISDRKRTQDALINIQKLEALGVLAGGIAHDFNNLMGGLFGYLDLARTECVTPAIEGYLDKAVSAIDRARGLTHQLLTFSKGGAPVQKTGPLFPFVEETARFALSGSSVSCRFTIAADLCPCNFDKNQIGQVIDNLIINAQQAMPAGGTIDVSAVNITLADGEHPQLPGGAYVKISVRDFGIGIPRELLSRIFDPFFTTKPRGHGLGLATCYSIMKRHGGCIDVDSEQGKGSIFHLYLPAAAANSVASYVNSKDTSMHKGSGTILVMDDEPMLRDTISAILQPLGFTVVCTDNGKSAVEYVAAAIRAPNNLAALIFDLTISGGMGGRDAIAEIRKFCSDIPAFVVSGYADDPVIRNPALYGFNASICKPFVRTELMEMLYRYLPQQH